MDREIAENRRKLIRALDGLGYSYEGTYTIGKELTSKISDCVLDKIQGIVSDFVVIPNTEGDPGGLARENIYKIYIKKK